ncbi:MAG: T9SS type A sorting domain-containing protein [Bacteroidota bacterium]
MKRMLLFCGLLAFGFGLMPLQAQRYLSEVFTDVTVTSDIEYAQNITVITGMPGMDTLHCDVYEPMGDNQAERPVVIISHTGSFLPVPLNGQATGNRHDSTLVEMCNSFAKRGFVAVAMEYRQGWNPTSTDQDVRTGTLLNAAYRGIQDARTLVRFLRDDYANGNTWGIDSGDIVMGGIGTGGYISLGCAYLDDWDEIFMPKFFNFNTNAYYLDTALSGDPEGKWSRPLNVGNYPSYSSAVDMAVNLGGACGDSTWIDAGETPCVSFHCPSDPFAPYKFGAVIVPTTNEFVVNVSGSHDVQRIGNSLGVNDAYINAIYTDPFTSAANMNNDGLDGLMPFLRPGPAPEGSPWDWWDTLVWNVPHPAGGTFNSQGLMTNPDMSATKARTYIDSIMNYLAPRIVCTLGLPGCVTVETAEQLETGSVTVFPNPTAGELNVRSTISGNTISEVTLVDLQGRTVGSWTDLKAMEWRMDQNELSDGMYFVKVQTLQGMITKKVIVE